jgi:carbon storage regulator
MLVLTRKVGEQVIIGGDITVTLLGMEQGRVRLGFKAPRRLSIVRAELKRRDLDRDLAAKRARLKSFFQDAELMETA